jgi:hypothetical protein
LTLQSPCNRLDGISHLFEPPVNAFREILVPEASTAGRANHLRSHGIHGVALCVDDEPTCPYRDLNRALDLFEASGHGFHDGAIGVVILESPDKSAAEAPKNARADIRSFEPHRDRIIVGPEGLRVGIIEPHSESAVIEEARVASQAGECEIGDHARRLQVIGGRKRSWTGGGLIQAIAGTGNASPTARICGNAEDELVSGNTSLKIRADRVVDVKILGGIGILLVVEEGRRVIGRGLLGAVVVVALQVEKV